LINENHCHTLTVQANIYYTFDQWKLLDTLETEKQKKKLFSELNLEPKGLKEKTFHVFGKKKLPSAFN